jgi:Holliday junction resolvase RusA-like endonuclease
MREEFTYIIPGVPVNANQCNKINRKEWSDLAAELETKKHHLLNQHNDQPPLMGPLSINAIFYFPERKKQKHRHYLNKPNTVFNLIRFVQKVIEGSIIAPNAYIYSFESTIGYSYEPRTIIIIEREFIR